MTTPMRSKSDLPGAQNPGGVEGHESRRETFDEALGVYDVDDGRERVERGDVVAVHVKVKLLGLGKFLEGS